MDPSPSLSLLTRLLSEPPTWESSPTLPIEIVRANASRHGSRSSGCVHRAASRQRGRARLVRSGPELELDAPLLEPPAVG